MHKRDGNGNFESVSRIHYRRIKTYKFRPDTSRLHTIDTYGDYAVYSSSAGIWSRGTDFRRDLPLGNMAVTNNG